MARCYGILAYSLLLISSLAHECRAEIPGARARLVWLFGDDDILRPSSSTVPVSRGLGFGDRAGYGAFFDAVERTHRGRDNLLQLQLSREHDALHPDLTTSAELALAVDLDALLVEGASGSGTLHVEDWGTRLGASLKLGAALLTLDLFPFDTDRVRLGTLRELSWGGTDFRRLESSFPGVHAGVPGAQLRLDVGPLKAFFAFKLGESNRSPVAKSLFGALAGAEVTFGPAVRATLGAGVIEHPSLSDSGGPAAAGFGAALNARLVVQEGLADARVPGELSSFRDDPWSSGRFESGWALAVESTALVQRLTDFDRASRGVIEPALAVALQGTASGGPIASALLLEYRELGFVLRNVPGLFPEQSLPRAGIAQSEFSAALSSAWTGIRYLVPELVLGLRVPAAFAPRIRGDFEPVVVRAAGDLAPLVRGSGRVPVAEGRLGLAIRISSGLGLGLFATYRRDNNVTRLVREGAALLLRRFSAPDFVGGGVLAYAEL